MKQFLFLSCLCLIGCQIGKHWERFKGEPLFFYSEDSEDVCENDLLENSLPSEENAL